MVLTSSMIELCFDSVNQVLQFTTILMKNLIHITNPAIVPTFEQCNKNQIFLAYL